MAVDIADTRVDPLLDALFRNKDSGQAIPLIHLG